MYRDFYHEFDRIIFKLVVDQMWLDHQFTFDGKRRLRRNGNGHPADWAFGFFIKNMVGVSQKPLTLSSMFNVVSTYMKEFFPNFLEDNPFTHPEKYAYPYKNIGIGHLGFVYMVHDRVEMLEYADEKAMKFGEFVNWAANHAFSYNDEVGSDVYTIANNRDMWTYLKNNQLDVRWRSVSLDFAVKSNTPFAGKKTTKYVNVPSWKKDPVKRLVEKKREGNQLGKKLSD